MEHSDLNPKSVSWRISNTVHGPVGESGCTPSRPPWKPVAAANFGPDFGIRPAPTDDSKVQPTLPTTFYRCWKQRPTAQLTVAPQYVSVTDLFAALPRRLRKPKPQPEYSFLHPTQAEAHSGGTPKSETVLLRSREVTPKSVLEAPRSAAKSPPSPAGSVARSAVISTPSATGSLANSRTSSAGRSVLNSPLPSAGRSSANFPPSAAETSRPISLANLPSRAGSSGTSTSLQATSRPDTSSSAQSQTRPPQTPGDSSLAPGSPKSTISSTTSHMRDDELGSPKSRSTIAKHNTPAQFPITTDEFTSRPSHSRMERST